MSAKTQVTITLGRSGRVVKRAGASSEIAHSDYGHSFGGKRPAKERLGNHSNGCCNLSHNKRQRIGHYKWSSTKDDHWIGQNDLRFKLMQKKMPRQTKIGSDIQDLVLHEKPLETAQIPVRIDACRHESESKISRGLEQTPVRSTDDLPRMNSFGKSYFHWHLDRFQHRSPDSLLGAYRGVSPPRPYCNSLKQVPVVSSVDPPRLAPVLAKCVIEAPQPVTFASKARAPDKQPKPVMQLPLPNGILKTSYLAEEATSVDSLLHSLGLGKYAIHFEAEEVDMAALKQMGDNDLKELGIPMGPRKKILLAVSMHPRQQHAGEQCSRAPKTCGNASVL